MDFIENNYFHFPVPLICYLECLAASVEVFQANSAILEGLFKCISSWGSNYLGSGKKKKKKKVLLVY